MAALTGGSAYQISPKGEEVANLYTVTGNDGDTIDLSSVAAAGKYTLSSIRSVKGHNHSTGLACKATFSGTVVTIAAGGSATSQVYHLWVIGHA